MKRNNQIFSSTLVIILQLFSILLFVAMIAGKDNPVFAAGLSEKIYDCAKDGMVTGEGGWCFPHFELKGQLSDIMIFSNCEWISGLTCRVKYNGRLPLPSEVFFSEFDKQGNKLGKETRLIYPKLNPGKNGRATFRIRSHSPARIVVRGIWNGPYKDPY